MLKSGVRLIFRGEMIFNALIKGTYISRQT